MALPAVIVAGQTGHISHHIEIDKLLNTMWANVRDPDFAGGAAGDGNVDDSSAIDGVLAIGSGTAYFPKGTYRRDTPDAHGNGATLTTSGLVVHGEGYGATTLKITHTVTWGIKVQASQCRVDGIRVLFTSGSVGSTFGVGVSCEPGGSVEEQTFAHIRVTVGTGTLNACFAAGPDHAGASNLDIANVDWRHCVFDGNGSTNGFLFGNGTVGNVLVQSCLGCNGNSVVNGVNLAGCGVVWEAGAFSNITGADIKPTAVCNDPVIFKGVRAENGVQVLSVGYVGNSPAGITLIDYHAYSYTPPDGHTIIGYNMYGPLKIHGGFYQTAGSTIFAVNTSNGTPAISLFADSVVCDNANPYPVRSAYVDVTVFNPLYLTGGVVAPQNYSIGRHSVRSGAPSGGISGDYWARTDTPGVANQRLYVNNAGSWVGIL